MSAQRDRFSGARSPRRLISNFPIDIINEFGIAGAALEYSSAACRVTPTHFHFPVKKLVVCPMLDFMKDIFVKIEDNTIGPLSEKKIKTLIYQGVFSAADLVWSNSDGDWVKAGNLSELVPFFYPGQKKSPI